MKFRFVRVAIIAILAVMMLTPVYAESPIRLIVDGKPIAMDVEPVIIDGRVMVPARYVAEALGAKVEWDGANQAVVITSKGAQASLTSNKEQFDPSAWVSIRELASHGVLVTSGPEQGAQISKNGVTVLIQELPTEANPQTMAEVSGSTLTAIPVMLHESRTYIRVEDARQLGFLP